MHKFYKISSIIIACILCHASTQLASKKSHPTLHLAILLGNEKELKKQLRNGATMHDLGLYGQTTLHYAVQASFNTKKMIQLCLQAHVDPLIQDNQNKTALDYVETIKDKSIRTLIKKYTK